MKKRPTTVSMVERSKTAPQPVRFTNKETVRKTGSMKKMTTLQVQERRMEMPQLAAGSSQAVNAVVNARGIDDPSVKGKDWTYFL
jgi:hypothetical protein